MASVAVICKDVAGSGMAALPPFAFEHPFIINPVAKSPKITIQFFIIGRGLGVKNCKYRQTQENGDYFDRNSPEGILSLFESPDIAE
jgi:hypothetical protein